MSDEVANLRQILAQTQAVQKSQEQARRRGEIEQQERTRQIVDKVDLQGRQVEESPEAREKKVDPEARNAEQERRKQRPAAETERPDGEDVSPSAESLTDEDGKGRVIDKKA